MGTYQSLLVHPHLFDCVTEMSTKCRKARVRIFVGLREYEVRSNPYYALNKKKPQLSGNEHKVPKGTGANGYIDNAGLQVS